MPTQPTGQCSSRPPGATPNASWLDTNEGRWLRRTAPWFVFFALWGRLTVPSLFADPSVLHRILHAPAIGLPVLFLLAWRQMTQPDDPAEVRHSFPGQLALYLWFAFLLAPMWVMMALFATATVLGALAYPFGLAPELMALLTGVP